MEGQNVPLNQGQAAGGDARIVPFSTGSRPIADLSDRELRIEKLKTQYGVDRGRNNPFSALKVWDADALAKADFPDPEWIVDGAIPTGLTVLAGQFKAGKSFLALQLAHVVSRGGLFLGELPTKKSPVLYFALEDTPRRIKNRMVKAGLTPTPDLRFIFSKKNVDLARLIVGAVDQWGAGLVVVDTMILGLGDLEADTNDYSNMYDRLSSLKSLADQLGIGIVLVHHLRKGMPGGEGDPFERILGSVGISGVADSLILLQRGRMSREGVLSVTGRDFEEREWAVNFDSGSCLWSITGEAEEVRLTAERREVLETLKEAKGKELSTGVIAKTLGKKDAVVCKLLKALKQEGYITSTRYGYWKLNTAGSEEEEIVL